MSEVSLYSYFRTGEYWGNIFVLLLLSLVLVPLLYSIVQGGFRLLISYFRSDDHSLETWLWRIVFFSLYCYVVYWGGNKALAYAQEQDRVCLSRSTLSEMECRYEVMLPLAQLHPMLHKDDILLGELSDTCEERLIRWKEDEKELQSSVAKEALRQKMTEVEQLCRQMKAMREKISSHARRLYFCHYMEQIGIGEENVQLRTAMEAMTGESEKLVTKAERILEKYNH